MLYIVTWREGIGKRRRAFTGSEEADGFATSIAAAYRSTFVTLTPYNEAGNPGDPILYFWDYDLRQVRAR